MGLHLPRGWLPHSVGEWGPQETSVPESISFEHPSLSGALLDLGLPRRRDELATRVGAGPGPALVGSQPLTLFPWPRRPASAPPPHIPPLPSLLGLRLQAPPAPPPANVALGPGPGPDSATRPSRSLGSSEGETRRAPGPGPTRCKATDTWTILVGGWVEGRVSVSWGLRAKGGGNVLEVRTRLFRAAPQRAPRSPRGRWTGAGDQPEGFLLLSPAPSPLLHRVPSPR